MAKSSILEKTINLVIWLTGVIVSLAVGFGLIDKVLTVRWIPAALAVFAGWVVVVLTVLGLVLLLVKK
jgi:hypothetical protein